MIKQEPVESHADRPIARSLLPFRIGNELGSTYLEYHNTLPSGQHQPFILEIGDENSDTAKQFNGLGCAIIKLMRMYWDLEKQIDGLHCECDQLKTSAIMMKSQLNDLTKERNEYERRYNDLKAKYPQGGDKKKNGG
jgi:hypothetical protein